MYRALDWSGQYIFIKSISSLSPYLIRSLLPWKGADMDVVYMGQHWGEANTNGWYLEGDLYDCIYWIKIIVFWLKFHWNLLLRVWFTHWGHVTHICISKITIIGSDNGLSCGLCQAIIWTNAGIFLFGHIGRNFNEILIEIYTFPFKKRHFKMSSGIWQPFCLSLNVLTICPSTSESTMRNMGKYITWIYR